MATDADRAGCSARSGSWTGRQAPATSGSPGKRPSRERCVKYLRRERNWPRDRSTVLGYWRVDQEAWLDRYARIGTELEQVYARAVAAGHSSDDALELYDDAVEAAGL